MENETSIRQRVMSRRITIVTNASGAFAATSVIDGEIVKLFYDRNSALDTGADLSITDSDTAESVWVENNLANNKTIYPRRLVQFVSGVDISTTYGPIMSRSLSIALISGGDTKTGYLTVFYK